MPRRPGTSVIQRTDLSRVMNYTLGPEEISSNVATLHCVMAAAGRATGPGLVQRRPGLPLPTLLHGKPPLGPFQHSAFARQKPCARAWPARPWPARAWPARRWCNCRASPGPVSSGAGEARCTRRWAASGLAFLPALQQQAMTDRYEQFRAPTTRDVPWRDDEAAPGRHRGQMPSLRPAVRVRAQRQASRLYLRQLRPFGLSVRGHAAGTLRTPLALGSTPSRSLVEAGPDQVAPARARCGVPRTAARRMERELGEVAGDARLAMAGLAGRRGRASAAAPGQPPRRTRKRRHR
jgi:hypothetical protein